LSSHKSIAKETQEEEGDDKNENNPRELQYQEQYAFNNGDNNSKKSGTISFHVIFFD